MHEGLRREAENRMRRLESIGFERRSWNDRALNADRQIESLTERRQEAEEEFADLVDAPVTRPLGLDEMVTGLSAFDFQ